jgi:hypothetical protein
MASGCNYRGVAGVGQPRGTWESKLSHTYPFDALSEPFGPASSRPLPDAQLALGVTGEESDDLGNGDRKAKADGVLEAGIVHGDHLA